MKKREGYRIVIAPECRERIANGQCPACGKTKAEWSRRTDWRCCSVACTRAFEKSKIVRSWPELRVKAFKRDGYQCVQCGAFPPLKKNENWVGEDDEIREIFERNYGVARYYHKERAGRLQLCAEVYDDSYLIGDHIIPIAIGGDEWDLDNVQTLCIACNKEKTRQDAKQIAKARSVERVLAGPQTQLDEVAA